MTRKTWSTVDVSAYLDGELTPEVQVAFETTVSQDPDLQHRVAEMRQVVALLRSVPLQEPPRNYILTPAMVADAESKPRPQRRRFPLLMMRIATSVAAAAFVVTSGLTLMQQGITPQLMTQSRDVPAAAILLENVPVEEFPEAESAAPEIEKAVEREVEIEVEGEVLPEAHAEPALGMQDTENIEEPSLGDDEDLPALELGTGSAEEEPTPEIGMGGGGEESELETDADSDERTAKVTSAAGRDVPDTTDTPPEEAIQAESEAAPAESAATEPMDGKEEAMAAEESVPPAETSGDMTTGDDSEAAARAVTQEDQAPEMAGEAIEAIETAPRGADAALTVWTPIVLGVVTAALAAITLWISRRQPD